MNTAQTFILLLFMGVITAAFAIRTTYAIDAAVDANRRCEALEARLAEAEAFIEFAKPLWP